MNEYPLLTLRTMAWKTKDALGEFSQPKRETGVIPARHGSHINTQ